MNKEVTLKVKDLVIIMVAIAVSCLFFGGLINYQLHIKQTPEQIEALENLMDLSQMKIPILQYSTTIGDAITIYNAYNMKEGPSTSRHLLTNYVESVCGVRGHMTPQEIIIDLKTINNDTQDGLIEFCNDLWLNLNDTHTQT